MVSCPDTCVCVAPHWNSEYLIMALRSGDRRYIRSTRALANLMRQEKREELLQASSAVYSGTGIFHFKTRRANKGLRG